MKKKILLIDADNLSIKDIQKAFEYSILQGDIKGSFLARNKSKVDSKLIQICNELSIEILEPSSIKKNGSDNILMMRGARYFDNDEIDGFILIASDKDFTDFVIDAKKEGKEVLLCCNSKCVSETFLSMFDNPFFLDIEDIKITINTNYIIDITNKILSANKYLEKDILEYLVCKEIGIHVFTSCINDKELFFSSLNSTNHDNVLISKEQNFKTSLLPSISKEELVDFIDEYIKSNKNVHHEKMFELLLNTYDNDCLNEMFEQNYKKFFKKYFSFNNHYIKKLKKEKNKESKVDIETSNASKQFIDYNSVNQAIKSVLHKHEFKISIANLEIEFNKKYGVQKLVENFDQYVHYFFNVEKDIPISIKSNMSMLVKEYKTSNIYNLNGDDLTVDTINLCIESVLKQFDDYVNASVITDELHKHFSKEQVKSVTKCKFSKYLETLDFIVLKKNGGPVLAKLK